MDENGNHLHRMASSRGRGKAYRALRSYVLSHPEELNERNEWGHTPLDEAIDYENESMMELFLQGDLSNETLLTAIGDSLAQYWYTGAYRFRGVCRRDGFLFRLLERKMRFSISECNFLLRRALEGNAWPFVPSLFACGSLSAEEAEAFYHWQIADDAVLRRSVTAKMASIGKGRASFFAPCEEGYVFMGSAPARARSRRISRGMKQKVWRNKPDFSLLNSLMQLY